MATSKKSPKAPKKRKPPRKVPIDWDQLRHDYEGDDLTLKAIEAKYDLVPRTVSRQAKDRGWKLRRPRLTGADKLKALVDKHIGKLEKDFRAGKDSETSEAQLNRLAALGRTLENISRLEKAAGGSDRAGTGGAPITDERRRELAHRLAALCRASGSSGTAEEAA